MKLQLIKKTVIAAALSGFAVAASAMTPMADDSLAQVAGQDGVNIAADLNVRIGEFRYTNTGGTISTFNGDGTITAADTSDDASVSFKNILIDGSFAMTMEVIQSAAFNAGPGVGEAYSVLGLTGGADAGTFHAANADVVKIAIPQLNVSEAQRLNFSVEAITTGNNGDAAGNGKSFGSFAMNDIRLQGTKVYIWAR